MWPGDALPQHGITNWSVFTGQKDAVTTGWQSWIKPPGCKWIYFLAVGAGGGGGRTSDGVSGGTGGGGGGSGAIFRALFPAQLFPDIIYIRPGAGGLGATVANNAGSNGNTSYVSIAPNTTAQNRIFVVNAGQGGLAASTGGSAGSAANATGGIWMNAAIFTSVTGQAGSQGAATTNASGSSRTYTGSGLFISGGAGGGNGTGAGGNITGSGPVPTISGGAAGGNDGNPGFNDGLIISPGLRTYPMLFSGGSGGGGASTAITAGSGGAGSYGSGGGGGGGGTNAGSTSGNGGDGGDAFILIGAF